MVLISFSTGCLLILIIAFHYKEIEWVFLSNLNPFNCLLLMSEVSTLKGTVHPKNDNSAIIYSLSCHSKHAGLYSSVYHKRRYIFCPYNESSLSANSWNILSIFTSKNNLRIIIVRVTYPLRNSWSVFKKIWYNCQFVSSSLFLLSIILMRNECQLLSSVLTTEKENEYKYKYTLTWVIPMRGGKGVK